LLLEVVVLAGLITHARVARIFGRNLVRLRVWLGELLADRELMSVVRSNLLQVHAPVNTKGRPEAALRSVANGER
jgi:hypothetical protein